MSNVEILKERLLTGLDITKGIEAMDHERYSKSNRVFYLNNALSIVILMGTLILIFSYRSHSAFLLLSGAVLTLVAGLVSIIIVRVKFNKKEKEILNYYDEKIYAIRQYCSNEIQVPLDYCETYILEKFYYYLENLLAETLSDCAKLYFQEENTERMVASHSAMASEIAAGMEEMEKMHKSVKKNTRVLKDRL